MTIYPAVDILDGRAVKLVGGKRGTEQVISDKPWEVARRWEKAGAEWLHVVDLNAAFGDGQNTPAVAEILAKSRVPVQVGGGIRSIEVLRRYLSWTAKRVILGTKAIQDLAWLEAAAKEFPDTIVLAIDSKGTEVMIKGWVESAGIEVTEFVKQVNPLPLAGYLYTNVRVEGLVKGLEWEPVEKVVRAATKPVIISGGVTTVEDIRQLVKLGVAGAVIGGAFYAGKLDFDDAREAAKA